MSDECCNEVATEDTIDPMLLAAMNYRDAGENCATCKHSTAINGGPLHACTVNPGRTLDVLATKVCDNWAEDE